MPMKRLRKNTDALLKLKGQSHTLDALIDVVTAQTAVIERHDEEIKDLKNSGRANGQGHKK